MYSRELHSFPDEASAHKLEHLLRLEPALQPMAQTPAGLQALLRLISTSESKDYVFRAPQLDRGVGGPRHC